MVEPSAGGGADTLSLDDSERGAPVPDAVRDRYELLGLLGRGGMGEVHKARDRYLGRIVALKVLQDGDPNRTVRFVRAARAQAKIDHPGICRVHDVVEIGGSEPRAYLVLQFIDGEPLHVAAGRMSLDEKVACLRDVAAAMDEAHHRGVVHRDLKPANIIVERREGRSVPIVTDFGLARETTVDAAITQSGAVLGTPAYMSPEQARGDGHLVDRRSDVYGLGATLYELLTGRPPFIAGALAQLLAQVIHDDPPPPRSLAPGVPVELETIALTCLDKDPAQRYASAGALARDLDRYLAGEPIAGRRRSRWQRLRLRARRHRSVVMIGAGALAIIGAIAALGVRTWLGARAERGRAAERTALAARLGREAEDIEVSLRLADLLPLHDTRPDRDEVRARMRGIAAIRHDLGELGDAIVHDALGRGHLALHQWRAAADELARAADAGLRTPELHVARGRALGELYRQALDEARRAGDRAWLGRRQRELEQQYLAPALVELEQGRASGDGAALLEARIALYRHDAAAAERGAERLAEHAPSRFEAAKLAGDAAYGAAVAAFDRGDYDAARPALDRAVAHYAAASGVARSDASVYTAMAQAWLQRAELDVRQGQPADHALDSALEAIDHAITADPDDGAAYTTQAYVLLRLHRAQSMHPVGDQRPLLDRIARAAARATELDPLAASAWDALGNAHIYRGIFEDAHGEPGEPWWNRARDEIARALAVQPDDPWANNDLAIAHRWLGDALARVGRDPMPEYREALRGYARAAELDPQYLFAWSNQTDLHAAIADHLAARGGDPRPEIDAAERAGARGLAVDPRYYTLLDALADAELTRARYLVETGGDPTAAIASIRDYLARADAIQPGNMVTWVYRVAAAALDAKRHLRDGGDPTASIAAGRTALREAVRLAPDSAWVYLEATHIDLVEMAWMVRAGLPPAAALARARGDAERAVALDPPIAEARLAAAEVYAQIAAQQRSRAAIDRGMTLVDQAVAINPALREAPTVRAALSRLRDR